MSDGFCFGFVAGEAFALVWWRVAGAVVPMTDRPWIAVGDQIYETPRVFRRGLCWTCRGTGVLRCPDGCRLTMPCEACGGTGERR